MKCLKDLCSCVAELNPTTHFDIRSASLNARSVKPAQYKNNPEMSSFCKVDWLPPYPGLQYRALWSAMFAYFIANSPFIKW